MKNLSTLDQYKGAHGKGLPRLAAAIGLVCTMAFCAAAGAWVQSRLDAAPDVSATQEQALREQAMRDSAYIRDSVKQLAAKVGDLQAKLIAVDSLSQRVAGVAGLSSIEPEIHAGLDADASAATDVGLREQEFDWSVASAEALGRHLDQLDKELAQQKGTFDMMDLALARQVGLEAALPTRMPVAYTAVTSPFGWRKHPISGRHTLHEGLDFAAPRGTPILAAAAGVVTEARYITGYGKMVEINHGQGVTTRYAHASSILVKLGDLVEQGQMIARVGSSGISSGPHLHFEVRVADHPLDPNLFLAADHPPGALVAEAATGLDAQAPQVR